MERPMRFGNQRSFEIVDETMKRSIKESIEEMGGYSMEGKYSHVLNKTHLQTVRENADSYRVTVGTFGKKYLMYLRKIDGKNFVFFINKKSGQIIKAKFTFMASLFEGTMAEGELVRYNSENGGEEGNDWIFLINDLIYYEGKDLMTEKWEKRNEKLQEMIEKKYRHDVGSPFKLVVKHYMTVDYAKSMVNDLMPRLKYKCTGLIFRNVGQFDGTFAYVFPDGEAKEGHVSVPRVAKISETISSSSSGSSGSSGNDFLDQLALGCEVVAFDQGERTGSVEKKKPEVGVGAGEVRRVSGKKIYTEMDDEEEIEQHQVVPESAVDTDSDSDDEEEVFETFIVKKTEYPDVYELYKIKSGGALEKHSYAAVSAMATSKMMKGVFAERSEARMKCRYNSGFKRWVPIECV